MMLPLALKLLLSVCIALSVSRATCDTVPAFLWSSEAIFNEGGFAESARTDRETTDASALVKAITTGQRGVLSRGDFAQRIANIDRLVVVLIEGQVTRLSLSQSTKEAEFLQSSVNSAASWLYLPYVQNDSPIAADQALRLGSCGGQQGLLLDQLKEALTTVSGRAVVSVCEGVPLAEIQDLQQFIQVSKLPYAAAYLGQPDHVVERPVARSLLAASNQSKKLCDGKCQAQVRLFETIILLVILLLALWIGMNMLHILDTPSRFETEKKEQNRHQD